MIDLIIALLFLGLTYINLGLLVCTLLMSIVYFISLLFKTITVFYYLVA